MSTTTLSAHDIKRSWQLVDAKDQILGRLATQIATTLMGKGKSAYVPHLDSGDFVVVINASQIQVSGQKENQKVYFRHSGFPRGDKSEVLSDLRKRKPEEIIRHAVSGMLPKTKLGKSMIKKLHIFAGKTHKFEDKLSLRSDDLKFKEEK